MRLMVNLIEELMKDKSVLSHGHAREISKDPAQVWRYLDKWYQGRQWYKAIDQVVWGRFVQDCTENPYTPVFVEVPDIEDEPTLWITGRRSVEEIKS